MAGKRVKSKSAKKSRPHPKDDRIYYAALCAILILAMVFAVTNFDGPTEFADDGIYTSLAYTNIHGAVNAAYPIPFFGEDLAHPGLLSIRYLETMPISLFYLVFGVSALSGSAWAIICYLLTIVVVFYMGRESSGYAVGTLAALLFAFEPAVLKYSTTVNDDITMMFITALCVLMFIVGMKRESAKWMVGSGFLMVVSVLATPQSIIIGFILVAYSILSMLTKRTGPMMLAQLLLGGVIGALAIVGIFYLTTSNPLTVFTINTYYYNVAPPDAGLPGYGTVMFPYSFASTLSGLVNGAAPLSVIANLEQSLAGLNEAGLYYYVLLISAAYLLLRRERDSYFLIFWFFLGVLYLSLGPSGISLNPLHYNVIPAFQRYLLMVAVPLAVVLSQGVISASRLFIWEKRNYLVAIPIAAVATLLVSGIYLGVSWHDQVYATNYSQHEIADYLERLGNATRIIGTSGNPDTFLTYMGMDNLSRVHDMIEWGWNCSLMPADSYVVVVPWFQYGATPYMAYVNESCPYWTEIRFPGAYNSSIISMADNTSVAYLYYIPSH